MADFHWEAAQLGEAIANVSNAMTRPFVLHRPKLSRDGNKWCALYGDDLQTGVAGFGSSPDAASWAFDKAWYEEIK